MVVVVMMHHVGAKRREGATPISAASTRDALRRRHGCRRHHRRRWSTVRVHSLNNIQQGVFNRGLIITYGLLLQDAQVLITITLNLLIIFNTYRPER